MVRTSPVHHRPGLTLFSFPSYTRRKCPLHIVRVYLSLRSVLLDRHRCFGHIIPRLNASTIQSSSASRCMRTLIRVKACLLGYLHTRVTQSDHATRTRRISLKASNVCQLQVEVSLRDAERYDLILGQSFPSSLRTLVVIVPIHIAYSRVLSQIGCRVSAISW